MSIEQSINQIVNFLNHNPGFSNEKISITALNTTIVLEGLPVFDTNEDM